MIEEHVSKKITGEWLEWELEHLKKNGSNNVAEYLDAILEPHDFHNITPKDIHAHLEEEKEVWVQGKCAFIDRTIFPEYVNSYEI